MQAQLLRAGACYPAKEAVMNNTGKITQELNRRPGPERSRSPQDTLRWDGSVIMAMRIEEDVKELCSLPSFCKVTLFGFISTPFSQRTSFAFWIPGTTYKGCKIKDSKICFSWNFTGYVNLTYLYNVFVPSTFL